MTDPQILKEEIEKIVSDELRKHKLWSNEKLRDIKDGIMCSVERKLGLKEKPRKLFFSWEEKLEIRRNKNANPITLFNVAKLNKCRTHCGMLLRFVRICAGFSKKVLAAKITQVFQEDGTVLKGWEDDYGNWYYCGEKIGRMELYSKPAHIDILKAIQRILSISNDRLVFEFEKGKRILYRGRENPETNIE